MTGHEVTVAAETTGSAQSEDGVVSIGSTDIARTFVRRGLVTSPEELGEEGFVIRSVQSTEGHFLILHGGSPRGTLYAVYDYLERFCRVGFFWDGERIPRLERLPLDGISVFQRPRFPLRAHLLDVVYGYTTFSWGWKEWRREIDWAAKHKLNFLTSPPGAVEVWKAVWRRFGVEVPPGSLSGPPFLPWASFHLWDIYPPFPPEFQDFVAELTSRQVAYARGLGMKMDSPWIMGIQVPREFYERYRDRVRFMEVTWQPTERPGYFVHPEDPLYGELLSAFMKEYARRYGTDHIWCLPNFGEMAPGKELPREEQRRIKMGIARSTLEAARSADPQARLICLTWSFYFERDYWPLEDVREFIQSFPDEAILVWDLWPDFRYPGSPEHHGMRQPLYEEFDFCFGKPWVMAFLHSFAGQTTLHGDLADAIARVRQVAQDPRGAKCQGLALNPERIHHNHLYFDLVTRLAWDPSEVELGRFLQDYAERRYGPEGASAMLPALRELAASVYGCNDATGPLYQFRLCARLLQPELRVSAILTLRERERFIPALIRALAIALEEGERLGDSELYQHDLIDVGRQLLGELFNARALRLADAFHQGRSGDFDAEAASLREILDALELLLASSDRYRLQPVLDAAASLPGAPPDYDRRIRDILTVWGRYKHVLDYARCDYYELVRFYYRKRVDAFLERLRDGMSRGVRDIPDEDALTAVYHPIEEAWVEGNLASDRPEPPRLDPVGAARELLARSRRLAAPFASQAGGQGRGE